MLFVRFKKEAIFQPRVSVMIERFLECSLSADVTPELDLICLYWPYSSHWSLPGRHNFFRNFYFENHFRSHKVIGRVMVR